MWSEAVFRNIEGDNQKLNQRMREVFEEAGIYKLSEQEKSQKLEEYYAVLRKSTEK